MSKPPASPVARRRTPTRRAVAFTTATIVSFSLTLLAGAGLVLTGVVPLKPLSFGDRLDIGAVLFAAPILALTLAVVFEAARIALKSPDLPEPRRQQAIRWSPGHREG